MQSDFMGHVKSAKFHMRLFEVTFGESLTASLSGGNDWQHASRESWHDIDMA